jgi:uncharacterized protein YjbJ (UPF0337 family)
VNKDRVNGTIDKTVGSAKRMVGELTGNTTLQIEGMGQQVMGKVENAVGKTKDAVQDAMTNAQLHVDAHATAGLETAAPRAGGKARR